MKITKDIKFQSNKKGKISMFDLLDDAFKAAFNITDEEYDYITERATDDELAVLVNEKPTFAEKRKMLSIRNKYLNEMNNF